MAFGQNKIRAKISIVRAYRYTGVNSDTGEKYSGVKAHCVTTDTNTGENNVGNEVVDINFPIESWAVLKKHGAPHTYEADIEIKTSRFDGRETIKYSGSALAPVAPVALFG